AVPVPRTADVAALLHDTDRLDADLTEPSRRQESREATPDEQHLDGVDERLARSDGAAVGVGLVPGQVAGQVGDELGRALGPVAEAEVALDGEPALDGVVVVLRVLARHGPHPATGPRRRPSSVLDLVRADDRVVAAVVVRQVVSASHVFTHRSPSMTYRN